ncbi:MAG TPA: hypothetical protein VEL47_04205, partial [Myxococcota bacterium]|nr:hypothetical protein [Myxococcota bacterium]
MAINRLLFLALAVLFSLTCFAAEEELIKQSLSHLENSKLYRPLGIVTSFDFVKSSPRKLTVSLETSP